MGRRRWPFQMVPNLLTEGQRVLDELRKETEDGDRGAGAAAHGGAADGAGTGARAGDAGPTAEGSAAAYQAARRAGKGAGLGPGMANYYGQMAAMNVQQRAQATQEAIAQIAAMALQGHGYTTVPRITVGGPWPVLAPKIEDAGITVGELVGWRWWVVVHGTSDAFQGVCPLLKSVVQNVVWPAGEPMCAGEKWKGAGPTGLYAFKDRAEADRANDVPGMLMVFGSVSVWGVVIEHERGYRAQYAKVRSLDRVEWLHPANGSRLSDEGSLAALRRVYGVEGAG